MEDVFPIENGDIPASYVDLYQMVSLYIYAGYITIFPILRIPVHCRVELPFSGHWTAAPVISRVVPAAPAPVPVTMATVPAHMFTMWIYSTRMDWQTPTVIYNRLIQHVGKPAFIVPWYMVYTCMWGYVFVHTVLGFQASDYVGL